MPQLRQKKKKTGTLTKDSTKKKADESGSDSEIDCDAPKTQVKSGSKKQSGGEKRKENREASEKKVAEEEARIRDAKANAQMCKEAGNKAFAEEKWESALLFFSEAIKHDPEDHVFFSNRSASNLQLKRTRDAVSDAEECVRLKPDWSKGYSRLGAALLADVQGAAAKEAYEKGLKLDPSNAALVEGLALAVTAAEDEVKRLEEEAREEEEANNPQGFVSQEALGPEETTVIGIDLGTTYSCVGVWMNGAVEIIDDESGSRTVPSWVAFTEDGGRLVGDPARQQAARNTKSTFYDIKRILGQKMSDGKVPEECKRFAFDVVEEPTTKDPRIIVPALDNKQMPPEQISGMILAHMKRIAERRLGHSVKKAVVTVPAYFNDAQRVATKAAGAVAGLDVLRVINEPTAAALAYGLDKKEDGDSTNILIFDLGGGTFDVSVLKIEGGMFVVQATGGDTHLGGEDFDNTVVDHFCDILKKKNKVDAKENPKLLRKLHTAVEKAKRALSSGVSAHVEVDDYSLELTRAKFESLNKAAFDRTLDTVKNVMKDAKMDAADIDEIVLVGGSTRIPKIQDMLSEYFNGRNLNKSVNPDEAVAYGAAVQGAILSGVRHAATQALLLVDVTPLSLGIELQGKHMSVIIPRNTSIPCKKKHEYTTVVDYQPSIQIPVFEGERPCVDGNRKLGEFSVDNIERAKKGEAKVEVTLDLDSNGILTVSAKDKKTQAKADCRIEGACKGLDQSEIERMVKEAETFAKEDAEYTKQLDLRMELEACAYDLADRAEASGNEKAGKQAQDVLSWLEGVKKLGTKDVGRQLENKLRELRGC